MAVNGHTGVTRKQCPYAVKHASPTLNTRLLTMRPRGVVLKKAMGARSSERSMVRCRVSAAASERPRRKNCGGKKNGGSNLGWNAPMLRARQPAAQVHGNR